MSTVVLASSDPSQVETPSQPVTADDFEFIDRACCENGWVLNQYDRDGTTYFGLTVRRSTEAATPAFDSPAALNAFLKRTLFGSTSVCN